MTDKSSREIERDLEQERAQLRVTIDEVLDRMTLEGAWNRAGMYMRENHEEFGQTLGRVIKEKPIAVGLVAIGMAWIIFGSSSSPRQRPRDESFRRADTRADAETRARLAAGDFDDTSARGPTGPDARPDPWAAPTRTPASASASQAKSEPRTGGVGGTPSPAKSTTTVPGGAASSSTGSPSGSGETRSGTTKPTTTTLGADALGSSSSSGGTTSTGSTPGSATKGAGASNTASRTTKTDPKAPKT